MTYYETEEMAIEALQESVRTQAIKFCPIINGCCHPHCQCFYSGGVYLDNQGTDNYICEARCTKAMFRTDT